MNKNNFFSLSLLIVVSLFTAQLEAKKPCCKPTNTACAANLKISSPSLVSAACNNVKVTCDCDPYAKDPNTCVAYPPTDFGPYGVGEVEVFLQDTVTRPGNPVPLVTTIWFPVSKAAASALPVISYHVSARTDDTWSPISPTLLPQVPLVAAPGRPAQIAVDGTNLKPVKNKFPLIIATVGGNRALSGIIEYLVSHGFVVVSPNPTGASYKDSSFGTSIPGNFFTVVVPILASELEYTLNWFLQENATPSSKFFNIVDPNRIAVFGASLGGYAGEALILSDARVKAFIGVVPGYILSGLPQLTVPFLDVGGSSDTLIPVATHLANFPLVGTPSCQKYWINVLGSGHASEAFPCQQVAYYTAIANATVPATLPNLVALGNAGLYANQGCNAPLDPLYPLTPDESLAINLNYVISFAKVFVAGDPNYLPFLTEKYFLTHNLPVQYHNGCSTTSSCLIALDGSNNLIQACATPNSPSCCQVAPRVRSLQEDYAEASNEKINELLAQIKDPSELALARETLEHIFFGYAQ